MIEVPLELILYWTFSIVVLIGMALGGALAGFMLFGGLFFGSDKALKWGSIIGSFFGILVWNFWMGILVAV